MGELRVRVQPRAKRSEVVGEREGSIVVRVAAPPVDGKANEALCALVAAAAGVPRTRVRVVRGAHRREKVIAVEGVAGEDVRAALLGGRAG